MSEPSSNAPAETAAVLSGGGEMGALMRVIDWGQTPVGPVATWPPSLKSAVRIMLECRLPMYLAWGEAFTQFYNDAYRPILGHKHPAAMGTSTPASPSLRGWWGTDRAAVAKQPERGIDGAGR